MVSLPDPPASRTQKRLLFADDEEHIRLLIRIACEGLIERGQVALIEAADGQTALQLARETLPDLILLDINMPSLSGLECCRQLRADPRFRQTPIVLLTGYGTSERAQAGQAVGATAYITKPFRPLLLVETIERLLSLETSPSPPFLANVAAAPSPAVHSQLLVYANDLSVTLAELRSAHDELRAAYLATVQALSGALEARDVETASHCGRVTTMTLELAQEVGYPIEGLTALQFGATLHDVGKIGVPDSILRKAGPLTDEEWSIIQRHPELGERMLRGVAFLRTALPIVVAHHERWDGSGYPRGLAGEAIPLGARIFVIADAIDAMTSDRPYRRSLAWKDAFGEVLRGRGRQFDPRIVDAFERRAEALRNVVENFREADGGEFTPEGSGVTDS